MLRFLISIRNYSKQSIYEFKLKKMESHKIEAPKTLVSISKEELIDLHRQMVTIRAMETTANSLYRSQMIRGFCHLCIGQEAIPVGIEASITSDDSVITAYRSHGFTYVRGVSIKEILAELMGKYTGCSKGKGGSMHTYGKGFYGGNGIVGAQVPLGAGIAFAHKYKKSDNICVALYGDGAANQGQVFEAFNMAKLWSLPCIFACENNQYAMGTSVERSSASTKYFTRGDYIPGILVDGMDVLAVKEAVRYAKKWVIDNKSPIILEFATYRFQGHSMSDPGIAYRTRDEVQSVKVTNDPIQNIERRMVDKSIISDKELESIREDVESQVEAIASQLKSEAAPNSEDLWKNVYVPGSEPPFLKGCTYDNIHVYSHN